MNCFKCGAPVTSGSRYCNGCGASVSDAGSATVATAGSPRANPFGPPAGAEDALFTQLRNELAGDYSVEREVGRGGMAIVYRAVEVDLNRVVALKVLPPEMAMAGGTAERFKREARMSAGLDHPNIIPVYRVGQAGVIHYMAVKFIEGKALDSIVESQGALPLPVVILVLRAAASALAYAHERGVVHRDIKGANMLVDRDGRVVVSDFGIARAVEEASLTASGAVIGTPYFMSPEQCAGQKVGPQSDQYSLGVVAFQLLTGEVPFQADSLMGILQHHFMSAPPDIRQVREDVPPALLAVIDRALAKKPEERFATTRDMVSALKAVPFSDDEEREAERMLRELTAGGTSVPKVRTGSLPPLGDAQRTSPPAAVRAAPTGAATSNPGRGVPTPGGVAAVPTATSRRPEVRAAPAPMPATRNRVPLVGGIVATLGVVAFAVMWVTRKAEAPTTTPATLEAPAVAAPAADSVAQVGAAPATGGLRFESLPPGATITVDGRPALAEMPGLAPGLHRFTVSAAGFEPWSSSAEVRAGEMASVTANLAPRRAAAAATPPPTPARERPPVAAQASVAAAAGPPGKVRIAADPVDAVIFVDGRQIGIGRALDVSVPSGSRRLRITAPGYVSHEETITVNAGETATKRVSLKPQGG